MQVLVFQIVISAIPVEILRAPQEWFHVSPLAVFNACETYAKP